MASAHARPVLALALNAGESLRAKKDCGVYRRVKYHITMSFCIVLTPAIAKVNHNLDGHTSLSSFSTCRRDNVGKWKDKSHPLSLSTSGSGSIRKGARRRFCCKSQITVAEMAPAASAAYGILLLAGGVFAFTRSGSKGSLFGGLTGATLMASAYFLMLAPDTKSVGDAVGFGSAFLFCSVFGIRLVATRKLIPAGPLLGLSLCALAVFLSAYLQDSLKV